MSYQREVVEAVQTLITCLHPNVSNAIGDEACAESVTICDDCGATLWEGRLGWARPKLVERLVDILAGREPTVLP